MYVRTYINMNVRTYVHTYIRTYHKRMTRTSQCFANSNNMRVRSIDNKRCHRSIDDSPDESSSDHQSNRSPNDSFVIGDRKMSPSGVTNGRDDESSTHHSASSIESDSDSTRAVGTHQKKCDGPIAMDYSDDSSNRFQSNSRRKLPVRDEDDSSAQTLVNGADTADSANGTSDGQNPSDFLSKNSSSPHDAQTVSTTTPINVPTYLRNIDIKNSFSINSSKSSKNDLPTYVRTVDVQKTSSINSSKISKQNVSTYVPTKDGKISTTKAPIYVPVHIRNIEPKKFICNKFFEIFKKRRTYVRTDHRCAKNIFNKFFKNFQTRYTYVRTRTDHSSEIFH